MKLEIKSFRTKVARRIFILFIICAILPISALALISFSHVEKQLYEQSKKRLRQESKSIAVSIYERLLFLRAEIKVMASNVDAYLEKDMQNRPDTFSENFIERFSALTLITDKGISKLLGDMAKPPLLTPDERRHLFSGNALLYYEKNPDSPPTLFMGLALDPDDPNRGILAGMINQSFLWEAAEGRPIQSELAVLDHSNNILFRSSAERSLFPGAQFKKLTGSPSGQFEIQHDKKDYLASYSTIFLKPNFFLPEWVVVLSESKKDMLGPMDNFKKTFPVIIILSLGMVFFLSMGLIKKNMGPIEILKAATRKIAQGAFGHKVAIKSGDEFETLGNDFNEMSHKLKEGQELLVRAAKMSTMGQMAAGVMHEIKQPLTAIHGHLQLSLLHESLADSEGKRLKIAMDAVDRLDGILERFKAFSQMSKETMEEISLNEVIDQVHQLFEHQLLKNSIHCTIDGEDDLPPILGDKQRLQQVISNLLINAMHALEDEPKDQRSIIMRTHSDKDHVFFEVQDNGCGIPEEIQDRIFDPFFTTKATDKGTGLGMAIIESILHEHHAGTSIESEVGTGTTFTIVFPVPAFKEAS